MRRSTRPTKGNPPLRYGFDEPSHPDHTSGQEHAASVDYLPANPVRPSGVRAPASLPSFRSRSTGRIARLQAELRSAARTAQLAEEALRAQQRVEQLRRSLEDIDTSHDADSLSAANDSEFLAETHRPLDTGLGRQAQPETDDGNNTANNNDDSEQDDDHGDAHTPWPTPHSRRDVERRTPLPESRPVPAPRPRRTPSTVSPTRQDFVRLERHLEQQQRDFRIREAAFQHYMDQAQATISSLQSKARADGTCSTTDPVTHLAEAITTALRDSSRKEQNDIRQFMARTTSKELPRFDGRPEDWATFISAVRATTAECGYSDTENMNRLQKALHGKARECVHAMLALPQNVQAVIKALELRFGRPDTVVQALVDKANRAQPILEGDFQSLIDLANTIRNLVTTMEILDSKGHLGNPHLRQELVSKLPNSLKLQWGEYAAAKDHSVTLADLATWMADRASAAAHISSPGPPTHSDGERRSHPGNPKRRQYDQTFLASEDDQKRKSRARCHFCSKRGHLVQDCYAYLDQPVANRLKWVEEEARCYLCLGNKHRSKDCRHERRCNVDGCRRRHHPSLHADTADVTAHVATHQLQRVLLRVVPVQLTGPKGVVNTSALLDEGSTATLLDAELATEIGASGPVDPLVIAWTNSTTQRDNNSRRVRITVSGSDPGETFVLSNVRTTTNLSLPFQSVNTAKNTRKWPHLQEVTLPPPSSSKPRLLIGMDNCHLIVAREVVEGPPNAPIATRTKLGWVLQGTQSSYRGRVDEPESTLHVLHYSSADDQLHQMVKQAFTTESFGITTRRDNQQSREDQRALSILEATTRRTPYRWQTGLLWRDEQPQLPPSKSAAFLRLRSLERKMDKDAGYAHQYAEKIDDYVNKGYARRLDQQEIAKEDGRTWYLPHFGVVNPKKPGKLRLVFDAAARTHGTSLNDALLTGPDLLNPLPSVLFTFREHRIGFTADIKEMFHQVEIQPEDQCAQRFLWRGLDRHRQPDVYQMEVMTFGAASSPCSAQYVKNINSQGEAPAIVEAITKKHYMDDYLDSVDDEDEAIDRIRAVIDTHKRGGFEIRHWTSNNRAVINSVPAPLRASGLQEVSLDSGIALPVERTLGLQWRLEDDAFTFSVLRSKPSPSGCTKRRLLKGVMSLFDPLGFLTSFTVRAKILLQDVWRSGIGWDDELPSELQEQWEKWWSELESLSDIRIPRCYSIAIARSTNIELHVFCDASIKAFAAVAYLRITHGSGADVAFVTAKSRVSPLKPMSVPRLELQAAVMGSRLASTVREQHSIPLKSTTLWTDSRTVLSWITTDAHHFRPFVAHRVGEIEELTDTSCWRWISTAQNPADDASRGITVQEVMGRWLRGPEFLSLDESNWPTRQLPEQDPVVDESEVKREFTAVVTTTDLPLPCLPDVRRFSSFQRLIRTTAWVVRFVNNLKPTSRSIYGELSPEELQRAERLWWRRAQADSFPTEEAEVRSDKCVSKSSRLYQLSPYLDEFGILRIKGRTTAAPAVSGDVTRPVILDPKHPFTQLLIAHHHVRSGHHGQERVVNELRQRYWVLSIRNAVRRSWSTCQLCKIRRAAPSPPEMAPLPKARLAPFVRPFTNTGMDYFGPMKVTVNRHQEKRYGVLFTCLSTRAVHLEIAHSLSTDSAIMSIRRLTARRGQPANIYSDNGTNFRGADNELKAALKDLDQDVLTATLSGKGIAWHFNPPSAPHMGGSWERLVRSVKIALSAILKERAPKEEVLSTVFAEAEGLVNSRPLTHVPVDADDPASLTPNHFLLGTSSVDSVIQAPGTFTDSDLCLRKQWRTAERLTDHFWKRWIREYIPTLTRRTKWHQTRRPITQGDLVVVVDDALPRGQWPRGQVVTAHKGRDGVVRVAEVKTASGTYRRPVTKLAVLDIDVCP